MRLFKYLVTASALLVSVHAFAQEEEGMEEGMGEEAGTEEAAEAPAEEPMAEAPAAAEGEAAAAPSGANYGMAGCGLGSLLFDADSGGFGQILAATTNGSSGTQTFGITTGTSNCEDTSGGAESAKAFVETNRVAFSKDAARGSGETINSLAQLAGCSDSAAVGRSLQRNFKTIFPNATLSDTEVSDHVITTLQSDASLTCNNLG